MNPHKRTLIPPQKNTARAWLQNAQGQTDSFAQFLFAFSGLNSLYWLFRDVRNPPEIEALAEMLPGVVDQQTQGAMVASAEFQAAKLFLVNRGQPLKNMDDRDDLNPNGGTSLTQTLAFTTLSDCNRVPEHLEAMLKIIYQARSNLVHGSKAHDVADDAQIVAALAPFLVLALDRFINGTYSSSA